MASAEPTTVAPTTVAPTTVAPTTVAPTTVEPTTVEPTTVAPTTISADCIEYIFYFTDAKTLTTLVKASSTDGLGVIALCELKKRLVSWYLRAAAAVPRLLALDVCALVDYRTGLLQEIMDETHRYRQKQDAVNGDRHLLIREEWFHRTRLSNFHRNAALKYLKWNNSMPYSKLVEIVQMK